MERLFFASTFLATLGAALIAGVFFIFSVAVMGALARQPAAAGISAMQAINEVILNPWFLGAFMGTAVLCVLLMVMTFMRWPQTDAAFILAGCLLYLIGSLFVTMVFNVPLNNELAAARPDSAEGAAVWTRYLSEWTAWNHVRTAASLASAASFLMALC